MRIIWLKDFEKKTPKQLLEFLHRNKFHKDYVLEWLEDDLEQGDDKLTMLQLCEKYREEIIDSAWNDITSA